MEIVSWKRLRSGKYRLSKQKHFREGHDSGPNVSANPPGFNLRHFAPRAEEDIQSQSPSSW